jgi:hypothetical protein
MGLYVAYWGSSFANGKDFKNGAIKFESNPDRNDYWIWSFLVTSSIFESFRESLFRTNINRACMLYWLESGFVLLAINGSYSSLVSVWLYCARSSYNNPMHSLFRIRRIVIYYWSGWTYITHTVYIDGNLLVHDAHIIFEFIGRCLADYIISLLYKDRAGLVNYLLWNRDRDALNP